MSQAMPSRWRCARRTAPAACIPRCAGKGGLAHQHAKCNGAVRNRWLTIAGFAAGSAALLSHQVRGENTGGRTGLAAETAARLPGRCPVLN